MKLEIYIFSIKPISIYIYNTEKRHYEGEEKKTFKIQLREKW